MTVVDYDVAFFVADVKAPVQAALERPPLPATSPTDMVPTDMILPKN